VVSSNHGGENYSRWSFPQTLRLGDAKPVFYQPISKGAPEMTAWGVFDEWAFARRPDCEETTKKQLKSCEFQRNSLTCIPLQMKINPWQSMRLILATGPLFFADLTARNRANLNKSWQNRHQKALDGRRIR
jgi:hypothetical protein